MNSIFQGPWSSANLFLFNALKIISFIDVSLIYHALDLPTLHLAPGSVVGLVHCWPGEGGFPQLLPFIPPPTALLALRQGQDSATGGSCLVRSVFSTTLPRAISSLS